MRGRFKSLIRSLSIDIRIKGLETGRSRVKMLVGTVLFLIESTVEQ